ncbi:SDR family oxidoreductase [Marinoscillum furvescens]|uniref:NAD(P)-dependent dehydrogenase (Short-subunit alcohol dehydrogenase family) n=1 Tax=Marinoscillum furvescens DSM 4134 TaxID=1122208 RepID=A0A3D9KZ79_MARFU|nr:SDR family oxidoreductase [Marinoscillum furvescens]RED93416.1 NAD(P)-dependent dehydrogenase (short-subunit alcohol dehydrogenase family) [Marinoscillum furvescens DSM 4134]
MNPIYQELSDKVIVITGGGGVLCGAMAETMARQNAKVAILDLRKENADKVAATIRQAGGTAIGVEANVLELESLQAAEQVVSEEFGPCDILINGAGGNHPKGTTSKPFFDPQDMKGSEELITFFDLDPDGVQFVFNLNFIGTLLPTQVFAKGMVGREGCSIINISSMNAFTPLTKIPAYSGAKAAVSNFTQWLAVHFAKTGIRVNALAPGFFLTDQNRSLLTKEDGSLTDRGNTIVEHTPMGRFGEAEDLEGTLLWLCSEGSKFVTGVVVPIDGGFSAFSGV